MYVTSPAFGLGYAARFLASFFRVKLGCLRQIGGRLTPSLGCLNCTRVKMKTYLEEVIKRFKKTGRYGALLKQLENPNLLSLPFIFEAFFANCFEASGINLDYEKNVNVDNDSQVDFYFQTGEHSKFCFELLRPEMKDELKDEYEKVDDDGFFGAELTKDHKKEYLRPEAQTIYLQEKLLEKVRKFPSPQTNYYSILVVDCSNIHFGHFDDEDCRMVMFGKTNSPIWQETWLHEHNKFRIKGLLEKEYDKRGAKQFREKITGVIFVPEISTALLKGAYISLNIHRANSYKNGFRDKLLGIPPLQNLQWVESP